MKKYLSEKKNLKFSEQVLLTVRAIISGFLVSTIGVVIWGLLLLSISPPWSILPMIFVLWAFLRFFSGSWPGKRITEMKRRCFRAIRLSPITWKWSIMAAIFFVLIVQSSFVLTFRIFEFPAKQFTADYKILDKMPLWIALAILMMSSLVAGVCEETGYRGYLQVPLEKQFGAVVAITISSVVFTVIHLSKTWAYPILPHIFFASIMLGVLAFKSGSIIPGIIGHTILDIFNYTFWWSGIAGGFKKLTIFKTGIDPNFIVWATVFLISVFIFLGAIGKLNPKKIPDLNA